MAPSIHPFVGYADASAAIDWLCGAFGFERLAVHHRDDGSVLHAERSLGPDVVFMLGSIEQDTMGLRTPEAAGGTTGGIYVAVDDVEAHCARAQAAGAEIAQKLSDDGYGKRYSARDLEGHLWAFGDYRPEKV